MNQIQEAARAWGEDARQAEIRLADVSRVRLFEILKKKITTSFIAPLATFEEAFGQLWGHKRRPEERTAEEQFWFERWAACREKSLDVGNAQVRAMKEELELHQVRWQHYKATFTRKP